MKRVMEEEEKRRKKKKNGGKSDGREGERMEHFTPPSFPFYSPYCLPPSNIQSSRHSSTITPPWENDDESPGCEEAKYIKSAWDWELVKYFCRALTS